MRRQCERNATQCDGLARTFSDFSGPPAKIENVHKRRSIQIARVDIRNWVAEPREITTSGSLKIVHKMRCEVQLHRNNNNKLVSAKLFIRREYLDEAQEK